MSSWTGRFVVVLLISQVVVAGCGDEGGDGGGDGDGGESAGAGNGGQGAQGSGGATGSNTGGSGATQAQGTGGSSGNPVPQACLDCVTMTCPDEIAACMADGECESCLEVDCTTAACNANPLFDALGKCVPPTCTACRGACD